MNRIDYIIGLGNDKAGHRIHSSEADRMIRQAREDLLATFGAFSERRQVGGYTGAAGEWPLEEGVCFVVYTDKVDQADRVGEHLKAIFRQSCIVVAITPCVWRLL